MFYVSGTFLHKHFWMSLNFISQTLGCPVVRVEAAYQQNAAGRLSALAKAWNELHSAWRCRSRRVASIGWGNSRDKSAIFQLFPIFIQSGFITLVVAMCQTREFKFLHLLSEEVCSGLKKLVREVSGYFLAKSFINSSFQFFKGCQTRYWSCRRFLWNRKHCKIWHCCWVMLL